MKLSDTEIFRLADDALSKADVDFAGYSGGGIHVIGGKESIDKVKDAVFAAGLIPQYRESIHHLNTELKKTQDELTAMEVAAKARLNIDNLVNRHGVQHVLLGLECITEENGKILRENDSQHNLPDKVADRWFALSKILGKLAREYADLG